MDVVLFPRHQWDLSPVVPKHSSLVTGIFKHTGNKCKSKLLHQSATHSLDIKISADKMNELFNFNGIFHMDLRYFMAKWKTCKPLSQMYQDVYNYECNYTHR